MKKIECFKASDGMLFERYEDAQIYEKRKKIEDDLRMTLNASLKESSLKDLIMKNYYYYYDLEASSFKKSLVNYLIEIMLRDLKAFKDVFYGGLSCK